MLKRTYIGCLLLLALGLAAPAGAAANAAPQRLPVPGMVTLLEMGASWCMPCRRMAPILADLAQVYEGRAAVVTLDVEEYPRISSRLGVRAVPTLIFFDKQGREVYRHQGFLSRQYIELIFAKLGVPQPDAAGPAPRKK